MLMLSLLVICTSVSTVDSWDPDAGIIESYTKMNHVTVTTTSGSNPRYVIDSDDNKNWVSGYCLPSGYFGRHDVNVMIGACVTGNCVSGGTAQSDLTDATDGDVYTVSNVKKSGAQAALTITVPDPQRLAVITVNGIFHDSVSLFAIDQHSNRKLLRTFSGKDNYHSVNIFDANYTVTKLEMSSASDFSIKEIAALGREGCTEQVTVDLGTIQRVGTIRTRHWAGTNSASKLVLRTSVDGKTWTDVSDLDPNAIRPVTTNIKPVNARFIALKYTVRLINYKHIYCYEIDAWDEHGVYGPHFAPVQQSKTFRELLGVNGIWGWGTKQYSDTLSNNDEGPLLYRQIASHARNYHNMVWDVTDPDNDPQFLNMSLNKGTQAKWWLNWDREYSAWNNAGMSVDISIQFTNKTVPQHIWDHPEMSASHYGHEVAKHFGSSQGNGLVQAVEVGNEPWDYDASFYATILRGMSSGLKTGDRSLTVLPGAFQADDITDTGNYIGTHVLPEVAGNIDVINCHTYSFITDNSGVRRGTYPENKLSSFNNIRPVTKWRDTNTPTKPIWVTEWGWDADGEGEDCANTECVSQKAQALYAVRGLMLMARSNVERATWFFYANSEDCNTLFCRSGLTTSAKTHFRKKAVFYAFRALLQHVGDLYFKGIVQENDEGFVYALGRRSLRAKSANILSEASHLVAWLPVDANNTTSHKIVIDLPIGVTFNGGLRMTGEIGMQSTHILHSKDYTHVGQTLTLTLSAQPIIVNLVNSQGQNIIG